MKKYLYIFAFCLPLLFSLKSYASPTYNGGQVYPSPLVFRSEYNYYLTTSSGFIAGYYDSINYQVIWYSKDSTPILLNGSQSFNSGSLRTTYNTVDNTVDVFTDLSLLYEALRNANSTVYDDTIGLGGKFWLLQSGGLANQMIWGAMWDYDDVRSFQLTIIGSKKSDKFDFTDNGGYWFNPFDYGVLGDQITLYLTPFDNNGNWGNTLTLSKGCYFDLADAIAQPFQGYVRKATNDIDIIGIDDTDIVTIVEKPDTVPITNPTVVGTTTVFSPVYQTTSQQSVVNYVENNYYTTNDYSTTINKIDKHTEFNFSIDFGDDSSSNLSRWSKAKSYLQDGASTIGGALDIFNGTLFAPIGSAIIIGLGVIIGLALILVIVKLLGVIF